MLPKSRNRLTIVFLVVSLSVAGCQVSTSIDSEISRLEQQAGELDRRLAAAKQELWRRQAELDAIEIESRLLQTTPAQPLKDDVPASNDDDSRQFVTAEMTRALNNSVGEVSKAGLVETIQGLRNNATQLAEQSQSMVNGNPLLDSPISGYSARLYAAETAYRSLIEHGEARAAQPLLHDLRAVFSSSFLATWIVCFLGLALVWAICRHDLRHAIRALRRSRVQEIYMTRASRAVSAMNLLLRERFAVAVMLMLTIVATAALFQPPNQRELKERYHARLVDHVNSLKSDLEEANSNAETVAEKLHKASTENAALLKRNVAHRIQATIGHGPVPAELTDAEVRTSKQLRLFAIDLGLAERAKRDLDGHVNASKGQDTELQAFADSTRAQYRNLTTLKAAFVAVILATNIGLIYRWQRKRRARREEKDVCPRCLTAASLKPVSPPTGQPTTKPVATVQCNESSCKYQVKAADCDRLRVCFPTAGYTQSGKTVWLTMLHRQVKLRRGSTNALVIDRAESPGVSDKAFEDILRGLVEQRVAPLPTASTHGVARIPEPLLFSFRDTDRWGQSSGIANVFDMAGESTAPEHVQWTVYQRALNMDGYLYFVDPTERAQFDKQREQLARFCTELRAARAATHAATTPVPIAVCISKLDMLGKPGEVRSGHYQGLIQELVTPAGARPPSLDEIRRRHEVFAPYWEQLFPGWDITQQLQNAVGMHYLYFPMTSAGFSSVTSPNPKDWNFQPFGILEPLLWLLHMHGFKTLR